MPRSRPFTRTALVGLMLMLMGVLVPVATSPANGKGIEIRTFEFNTEFGGWTRTANQGGRAYVRGAVRFHGRFHIDVSVFQLQDQCSSEGGDGVGAKVYLTVFLRKLPTPGDPNPAIAGDTRILASYLNLPCDDYWVSAHDIDYFAGADWDEGWVIEYVSISLRECTETACSDFARDHESSRKIDNPYEPGTPP